MICEKCNRRQATQHHHLFSNTKLNRRLYGKLLDDKRNIQLLCEDCHLWKPVDKLSEQEFCKIMGIEPRSKSSQKVRKIAE